MLSLHCNSIILNFSKSVQGQLSQLGLFYHVMLLLILSYCCHVGDSPESISLLNACMLLMLHVFALGYHAVSFSWAASTDSLRVSGEVTSAYQLISGVKQNL